MTGTASVRSLAARPDCLVSHETLRRRLREGWSIEDAVTTPAGRRGRRSTIGAVVIDACREPGCVVGYRTVLSRLARGWDPRRALETPVKSSRATQST